MIKLEQSQLDSIISSINSRSKLASPTFTGTPTVPTAAVGTNNNQIASTAFVLANAGPELTNKPAFRVSHGTAGPNEIIVFAQSSYNIGNHFSPSTGTFTAPFAGRYQFSWNGLHGLPKTTYVRVLFSINGSAAVNYGDSLSDASAPNYISTALSQCFYLNAGDNVKLWNEGNKLYGLNYSSFSGYFVGI